MHIAGVAYHVFNRAAKRAQLFTSDRDYDAFERVVCETLEGSSIALFAYSVMPNHWHFVLSPTVDGGLSSFMHRMETKHVRRWQISQGLEGQGAVYQGRFKDVAVSNDRHFLTVCRYVERNPVRASLVERAEDWRWSSLSARNAGRPLASLISDWPVARPSNWTAFVNTPQTQEELEALRRAVKTGEPLGDAEWRDAFEARLKEISRIDRISS
jgi:putative transposase